MDAIKCAVALLLTSGAAAQPISNATAAQYDEADEISLREYTDVRIDAVRAELREGLDTAKEAVLKAEDATETRFQSVNEFRAQLDDQQRTFMPRLEYEQAHQALINRVDELAKRVAEWEARSAERQEVWPVVFGVVGAIGILFTIVAPFFRKVEPMVASRK